MQDNGGSVQYIWRISEGNNRRLEGCHNYDKVMTLVLCVIIPIPCFGVTNINFSGMLLDPAVHLQNYHACFLDQTLVTNDAENVFTGWTTGRVSICIL